MPGPKGAWTEELCEAFLALLAETGNARASARSLGQRHLFNNRMRRDRAFRRRCEAAIRAADARLSRLARAQRPFLRPFEVKSMPPGDGPPGGGEEPAAAEPVIRRTSNGRTQISYVHEGNWTGAAEAGFLARLRLTGNIGASARSVGFSAGAVYRRIALWPAFARDVEDALDEAEARLDHRLVAYAHALLRRPGDAEEAEAPGGDFEDVPFDPEAAMRILGFLDRRRSGRTTRGRRRPEPERDFAAAVDSVLAKIEAIERHSSLAARRSAAPGSAGAAADPGPDPAPRPPSADPAPDGC